MALLSGLNVPGTNPPQDYSDATFTITAPASATTTSHAAPSNLAAVLASLSAALTTLADLLRAVR